MRTYDEGQIIISTWEGNISAKSVALSNHLAGANTISFNGKALHFGADVPEEDRLSYSLPPKPFSGAFDVRFAGGWQLCNNECMIEIMSQDALQIDYHLVGEEDWELTDIISGREFVLTSGGSIGGIHFDVTSQMSLRKKGMSVPENFSLYPAFPNPFNPETNLKFTVPSENESVSLKIINVRGQVVNTLVSGQVSKGVHSVSWDGTNWNNKNVGAGIYFGVLIFKNEFLVQKIMLLNLLLYLDIMN